ncbi:MAG: Hsp33 family molecular chaperone [Bauldia sp.]|nr:Hsp33 family molecular chaperone [Bauldia sp.]
MTPDQPGVQIRGNAGDDVVRPFQVEALDVRGRAVQLGPALDALLGRHDYPAPVSKLVAEAVVLAALLGTSLKFQGKFILQTKTEGPVDLLVVEFRTPGDLRAYARFKPEVIAAAEAAGEATPGKLLGKGFLALTIDQGDDMQRYQGIVELDGATLEEVAHTYFRQSEQIPTRVRLAAAELMVRENGKARRHWRAGGLLAQFMPAAPERMKPRDLPGGDLPEGASIEEEAGEDDAWQEAQATVGTIADIELVDSDVPVDRLLYRLFHERGVRVFDPTPVRDKCNCSRERIAGILHQFTAEAVEQSIENGRIHVTCEFCGKKYDFDPAEFLVRPPDAADGADEPPTGDDPPEQSRPGD